MNNVKVGPSLTGQKDFMWDTIDDDQLPAICLLWFQVEMGWTYVSIKKSQPTSSTLISEKSLI